MTILTPKEAFGNRPFHVMIKTTTENTSDMKHYFAIADRPSRAIALLEESEGWRGSDKISVEAAVPQTVSPDIKLEMEAVWRI